MEIGLLQLMEEITWKRNGLLFNANWAMSQLYHGQNKLLFVGDAV
jgi:hypothetical protein